jgi:hypothetical protein
MQRCEHYSIWPGGTRDHLCSYEVSTGLYDIEYLKALFDGDESTVSEIENSAYKDGFGPLAACLTVWNQSSVKVHCHEPLHYLEKMLVLKKVLAECEHGDSDGKLVLAEMAHLRCFEPLEEYHYVCPKILVVCRGGHTHPIRLPAKTPQAIRAEVFELLKHLDMELPDLTAHRFLRHLAMAAYLQKQIPEINHPTLDDLHISLTNRKHINTYILQVQQECFPFGTGWKGEWTPSWFFSNYFIIFGRASSLEGNPRCRTGPCTALHLIYSRSAT